MTNQKKLSLGLLVTAVICFVLVSIFLKMGNYSHAKNLTSCDKESELQTKKDSKKCAVWDGSQCRKGQLQGSICMSPPNKAPFILMIMGVVFLIAAIITFIISKMTKKMVDKE